MANQCQPSQIKRLRKDRLWSQEDLAVASGLGLRTIQRVESSGHASDETLKALAATFEVNWRKLLSAGPFPRPYHNVQFGYVTVGVTLAVAGLATLALIQQNLPQMPFVALIIVCGLITSTFATLTTEVRNDAIQWRMGLGLVRKSVSATEIAEHRVVRNKGWWGWGIRLIPNGWLYNVSGFDAVELVLKNERVIRIGTDDAEEFAGAIEEARRDAGRR